MCYFIFNFCFLVEVLARCPAFWANAFFFKQILSSLISIFFRISKYDLKYEVYYLLKFNITEMKNLYFFF